MVTFKQLYTARRKADKAHTKAASAWRRARTPKGIARAELLSAQAVEASNHVTVLARERELQGTK